MAVRTRPNDAIDTIDTHDTHDAIDALASVTLLVQRLLDRSAAEHGVAAAQARMLRALTDASPTLGELARLLGLDKSSTSGLVDRAQHRGLVRRVPSQLDRRSVRVRLTGQGRELAEAVSASFAQELAAVLEPLSADESASLSGLLRRVQRD